MNYMTNDEVISILNQIDKMNEEINNCYNKINNLNTDINNLKTILRNYCNHKPMIDHTMNNEKTEYICSVCKIYL